MRNQSDKKEQKSLPRMFKHYSKPLRVVEEEAEVFQDKLKLHLLLNKNHKLFLKFNNQNLQSLEFKKLSIQEDHL